MKQSENISELATALAKAQGEFVAPPKDKTAQAGQYSYSYSDLATVIDTNRAVLAKHGLSVVQGTDEDERGFALFTKLIHSSGQWIQARYPLAKQAKAQALGAEITYGRRYSLSAIIGVASEEDTDAKGSDAAPSKKTATVKKDAEERPTEKKVIKTPVKKEGSAATGISEPQRKRLFALMNEVGIPEVDLREHMKATYKVESTKELTQEQYKGLITWIELSAEPGATG